MDMIGNTILLFNVIKPIIGQAAGDRLAAKKIYWYRLVHKSEYSWQLPTDYQRLNVVTIKEAYPLPRVVKTQDALSDSIFFSTL